MTGPVTGPRAGDRLGGRYTVTGALSEGAMGAVHVAETDDGRRVAVKRLLDVAHRARFDIEARLLSGLAHPRVVRVLDHFSTGDEHYLVMELVEGPDLGAVARERGDPGLPVDEVLAWAAQACEAVEYIHGQQVLHRDVKPQNLVLGPDGVVLVDFGIAREAGSDRTLTRAVGTPGFMAPEVAVGEEISPRSDVYSLAATVWALLTGEPPTYADATSLQGSVPGVSPELEAALRRGLALRPEHRLPTARALAEALGATVGTSPGGVSLAAAAPRDDREAPLLESIVRTAAGVFEAASVSVALVDRRSRELVFEAAWGTGAKEILGVRLVPGVGIAGAAVESGEAIAVEDCRADPRFAAQVASNTGYVPHTMLVVPLRRRGEVVGALSILDRRDGRPYGPADVPRAELFAELTVSAIATLGTLSPGGPGSGTLPA